VCSSDLSAVACRPEAIEFEQPKALALCASKRRIGSGHEAREMSRLGAQDKRTWRQAPRFPCLHIKTRGAKREGRGAYILRKRLK